jgi:hypothetical protein
VVPAEFAEAARELLEFEEITDDDEWLDESDADDNPEPDSQKPQ